MYVVDADKVAGELLAKGQPALQEVVNVFGNDLLLDGGELDRAALARIVFSEQSKLKQLESIVHPLVRHKLHQKIKSYRDNTDKKGYVVFDIPLLIEQGYTELVDYVVVVDCLQQQQLERVVQRDGRDIVTIQHIIDQQCTRGERLAKADIVLDNTKTRDVLLKQVNQLHQRFFMKG